MIDILVLQIVRPEKKALCRGCKVSLSYLVHCVFENYFYDYRLVAVHTVLENKSANVFIFKHVLEQIV